jgi:hypothetical protein
MPIPKENAKLAPCGAHFREARGQNGGRKEKQDKGRRLNRRLPEHIFPQCGQFTGDFSGDKSGILIRRFGGHRHRICDLLRKIKRIHGIYVKKKGESAENAE